MAENNEKYFPTIQQSFGLIIGLLLLSIPVSLPFFLIEMFNADLAENSTIKGLSFLIPYTIIFLWIIKIASDKIREQGLWELKWKAKKLPFDILGIILIMTLALIIIIEPLSNLIPMPESIAKIFEDMFQPNIYTFLASVIAAPILEELLFRGIILEGFLKNYSPWKAIIWSSVIFGMAHLNPWQAIGAILIGIFIGWIYVKTNSLIPGIMIHFTNNFLAFMLMAYSTNSSFYFFDSINSTLLYTVLFIVSLVSLVIGIIIINKKAVNIL